MLDGAQRLFVRIGADFTGATAGFNQLNRSLDRVAMDAAKVGAALAGAAVAVGKFAERGGEVLNVSAAFTRQVGNQETALRDLRSATMGLVSDFDLMVGFNRAATLGAAATREEYANLARTAIALGKALGQDAAFALESLSLGIGRQSKLILDNLGLIVSVAQANEDYAEKIGKTASALTDAERRDAFRTAALEAARAKVEQLGGAVDSAGDDWVRFTTDVKNARDELALLTAQSDAVGRIFGEWALMLREWRGVDVSAEAVLGSLANLPDDLELLQRRAIAVRQEFVELNLKAGDFPVYARGSRAYKSLIEDLEDAARALSYLEERIQSLQRVGSGAGSGAGGAGFMPPALAYTEQNARLLAERIDSTRKALSEARFDLGFAKTADEADTLLVKIQELEGALADLRKVAASFKTGEMQAALAAFGAGPGTLAGLGGPLRGHTPSPHGGFVPSHTLGTEPVEALLDASMETAGALDKLKGTAYDVGDAFLNQVGRMLDPAQIASNLASWGIGSLLSVGFGMLNREDPELKRIVQALHDNAEALQRNTAALTQSLVGGTPGSTITNALGALEAYLTDHKYPSPIRFEDLAKYLADVGLTMKDLEEIAAALDLTLVETGIGLLQLREALKEISAQNLVGTLSGQLSLLDREFSMLDIEDPAEKITSIMGALSGWVTGDLATSLAGVDWTHPDAFLSDLLASIRAGTFDLSQLEGIGLEEFLDILAQLETFGDELGNANEELTNLTSTLRNVPTGFKVALERFRASDAIPRTIRTDPGGGGGGAVFNVSISGATKSGTQLWTEIKREIDREYARGGALNLQLVT